jgi:hypothetical protein
MDAAERDPEPDNAVSPNPNSGQATLDAARMQLQQALDATRRAGDLRPDASRLPDHTNATSRATLAAARVTIEATRLLLVHLAAAEEDDSTNAPAGSGDER